MAEQDTPLSPSLFEPESRGGDIAESGFSFQENYILSCIPMWLSQEGFTGMIREAIGDTEAKFFVPGYGYQLDLIEVKNHSLAPTEFWKEIDRFQRLDRNSPGEYRQFILVSSGISNQLLPLVHGLRRIRYPHDFYADGSVTKENSLRDYIEIVERLGYTAQEAVFLLDKVAIEPHLGPAHAYGEALFRQALADHLPYYELLSSTVRNMYERISTLVRKRRNELITRQELEIELRAAISPQHLPPLPPISLYTAISDANEYPLSLHFNWSAFWGGSAREYPSPTLWNEQVVESLRQAHDWIIQHRSTRRIRLLGNRRLSTSIAIGAVFPAVGGFAIDMQHRDQYWQTDLHPTAETPPYVLEVDLQRGQGQELVVSLGIGRKIAHEVELALASLELAHFPRLHMSGEEAILSPDHANAAVREIKLVIGQALSQASCQCIHLFYAGPAHLALFLGHRLNATSPIQCYEWVSTNRYVPTCRLFS